MVVEDFSTGAEEAPAGDVIAAMHQWGKIPYPQEEEQSTVRPKATTTVCS